MHTNIVPCVAVTPTQSVFDELTLWKNAQFFRKIQGRGSFFYGGHVH